MRNLAFIAFIVTTEAGNGPNPNSTRAPAHGTTIVTAAPSSGLQLNAAERQSVAASSSQGQRSQLVGAGLSSERALVSTTTRSPIRFDLSTTPRPRINQEAGVFAFAPPVSIPPGPAEILRPGVFNGATPTATRDNQASHSFGQSIPAGVSPGFLDRLEVTWEDAFDLLNQQINSGTVAPGHDNNREPRLSRATRALRAMGYGDGLPPMPGMDSLSNPSRGLASQTTTRRPAL